jgi:hypothetical protein
LILRAIAPILSRTIPVALVIGRPLTWKTYDSHLQALWLEKPRTGTPSRRDRALRHLQEGAGAAE